MPSKLPSFPQRGQPSFPILEIPQDYGNVPKWFREALSKVRLTTQLVRWFSLIKPNIDAVWEGMDTSIIQLLGQSNELSDAVAQAVLNRLIAAQAEDPERLGPRGMDADDPLRQLMMTVTPDDPERVLRQAWDFAILSNTEANLANYPAAQFDGRYFIATDSFKTWYSANGTWVQIYAPQLLIMLAASTAYGALKSGTDGGGLGILMARLGDDSAFADMWVLDGAYAASWNGNQAVPTKNAVYDKVEALQGIAFQFGNASTDPADSTDYYLGAVFSAVLETTGGNRRIYIPKAGTIKKCYLIFLNVGAGSNEASSIYIRLNDTTDTLISNAVDNSSAEQNLSNTALAIAVVAGDYVEIKWTTPAWATNPTGVFISGSIYIE